MGGQPNSDLMDALAAAFAKNVALHGTFDADDGHVYVDVKPDENAFVTLDGSFSLRELACIVSFLNSTL